MLTQNQNRGNFELSLTEKKEKMMFGREGKERKKRRQGRSQRKNGGEKLECGKSNGEELNLFEQFASFVGGLKPKMHRNYGVPPRKSLSRDPCKKTNRSISSWNGRR